MRIVSGTAKGLRIESPKGVHLRPMMEQVREALFNMLTSMGVIGGTFLDLYSGTGAVGIEALSRGFDRADFVEQDYRAANTIETNLKTTGLADRGHVHRQRVENVVAHPELLSGVTPYDAISVTPPYEDVDYFHIIDAIVDSALVGPGTIMIVEYPGELGELPANIGPFEKLRDREYGRTRLGIYVYPFENSS